MFVKIRFSNILLSSESKTPHRTSPDFFHKNTKLIVFRFFFFITILRIRTPITITMPRQTFRQQRNPNAVMKMTPQWDESQLEVWKQRLTFQPRCFIQLKSLSPCMHGVIDKGFYVRSRIVSITPQHIILEHLDFIGTTSSSNSNKRIKTYPIPAFHILDIQNLEEVVENVLPLPHEIIRLIDTFL